MKTYNKRVRLFPGSAGRWPAVVVGLPAILCVVNAPSSDVVHVVPGEPPSTAGWQPALPNPKESAEKMSI